MSLNISFDKHYGGFYFHKGYMKRLCLGYIAVTYILIDFDEILEDYTKYKTLINKESEGKV